MVVTIPFGVKSFPVAGALAAPIVAGLHPDGGDDAVATTEGPIVPLQPVELLVLSILVGQDHIREILAGDDMHLRAVEMNRDGTRWATSRTVESTVVVVALASHLPIVTLILIGPFVTVVAIAFVITARHELERVADAGSLAEEQPRSEPRRITRLSRSFDMPARLESGPTPFKKISAEVTMNYGRVCWPTQSSRISPISLCVRNIPPREPCRPASTSPFVTADSLRHCGLRRHRHEHQRSELQRSSQRKLRRCVLQNLLRDLERWRLDDCSRQVVNLRDRHVATVRYGAEQIAREILHHW